MVTVGRRSRLNRNIQIDLIKYSCAGVTARSAAELTGLNRNSAIQFFYKLRELIFDRLALETPELVFCRSYINFYLPDDGVILPVYAIEFEAEAIRVVPEAYPDRKIVPVYVNIVALGNSPIHCITQEQFATGTK